MTTRNLPHDSNGFAVPALEPGDTTATISVGAASARAALPAGCNAGDVVRLASDTNCYVRFGDSAVDAATSDMIFPVGVEVVQVPRDATHVAVIQSASGGTFTINELF